MNKPIERELKHLLSPSEYEILLSSYPFSTPFVQTNTYYDTKDSDLKNHHIALRIRKTRSGNILTVKIKTDAITHIELEKPVKEEDPNQITDPQIRQWFEEYHIPFPLSVIASFSTKRAILENEQAVICLDENTFGDHTDHEIEYEYKQEHDGIPLLNAFLQPAKTRYTKNCPSKLARAIHYNLCVIR
ncbi:MAG: CYTH domain-containing protein [Erysipelotrichaceae bacterium]|nr:CYTH domain-containing protein [Erysipelotrichaceae bacterium]